MENTNQNLEPSENQEDQKLSNFHHRLYFWLALAAIGLVGIGLLAAIYNFINEEEIVAISSSITKPSSSSRDVDTKNWQTYSNEEYGFEVKFPSGVKFEKSETNYLRYKFQELEGAISVHNIEYYQQDWPRLYEIMLNIKDNQGSFNNVEYNSNNDPDREPWAGPNNYTISKLNVAGYSALDYRYTSSGGVGRDVYVIKGDTVIQFFHNASYSVSENELQEGEYDLFNRILSTFKFIEPVSGQNNTQAEEDKTTPQNSVTVKENAVLAEILNQKAKITLNSQPPKSFSSKAALEQVQKFVYAFPGYDYQSLSVEITDKNFSFSRSEQERELAKQQGNFIFDISVRGSLDKRDEEGLSTGGGVDGYYFKLSYSEKNEVYTLTEKSFVLEALSADVQSEAVRIAGGSQEPLYYHIGWIKESGGEFWFDGVKDATVYVYWKELDDSGQELAIISSHTFYIDIFNNRVIKADEQVR